MEVPLIPTMLHAVLELTEKVVWPGAVTSGFVRPVAQAGKGGAVSWGAARRTHRAHKNYGWAFFPSYAARACGIRRQDGPSLTGPMEEKTAMSSGEPPTWLCVATLDVAPTAMQFFDVAGAPTLNGAPGVPSLPAATSTTKSSFACMNWSI